jgi:FRG domain
MSECAGVQIRQTIESSKGRISWVTDEAANRLRASGALLSTGEEHFVPRYVAYTPRDLERFLAEYQCFAEKFASRCLLRGQSCDYFDDDGNLCVQPSAFRTPKLRKLFASGPGGSHLDEQLSLWDTILSSLGIDVDSRVKHKLRLENGGKVFLETRDAAVRIASNPQLGAILEHYGFPTPHLDVTTIAAVALYFALHKATRTRGGLCFNSVETQQLDLVSFVEPFPSIHLYFSSAHLDAGAECIDLCSLPDLVKVARRPTAQHAYSLTCVAHAYLTVESIDRWRSRSSERLRTTKVSGACPRLIYAPAPLALSSCPARTPGNHTRGRACSPEFALADFRERQPRGSSLNYHLIDSQSGGSGSSRIRLPSDHQPSTAL